MLSLPVATREDVTELLGRLVATPSVSPEIANGAGESGMADLVEEFARGCGAQIERTEVLPGRPNIVATLPGGAGPVLMLEAHMDTVALGPMTDGHHPRVDDGGHLHGRGACDTKGSLSAMLLAFRWASRQPTRSTPLRLAAVIDEEKTGAGAKAVAESAIEVDGAIVGEPTRLAIVRAHRGFALWRVIAHGVAAHSSMPERGVNAAYALADAIRSLRKQFESALTGRAHPLSGPSTFSINVVRAGDSVNVVPDRAEMLLERRPIPGEQQTDVDAEVRTALAAVDISVPNARIELDGPFVYAAPLDTPEQSPLVQALARAVGDVLGRVVIEGATYGSDASYLQQRGIPCVLFGPGDIRHAHSADEWVAVDDVVQAAHVYARVWQTFGQSA